MKPSAPKLPVHGPKGENPVKGKNRGDFKDTKGMAGKKSKGY